MERFLTTALLAMLVAGCAQTQLGQGGSMATGAASVAGPPQQEAQQLAKCSSPLGTVALVEEQIPALAQAGLSSPIPVLRLLVSQSGCFNVVDRGQALTRIQEKQALTGTGGSRQKLAAAQYFLTPNILFEDSNSGGAGAALGAIGSMLPGMLGFVGSGLGYQASEAQALLFLTQTSTGMQIVSAEGSAQTRDWALRGSASAADTGAASVATRAPPSARPWWQR